VVINNSGQNEAYPSSYQQADQIIRLDIGGWYGLYQQVRVIDPPDLSPYAPDAGWCGTTGYPACTAALPYEGNDNYGTDFGLSNNPAGPWYTTKLYRPGADNLPPDSTNNLTLYLKVPARYSGNNFQVEVTKCDYNGTPIPTKVAGLSSIYTAWKRVYVERDSMFRRGGLLYAPDDTHMTIPAGSSSLQVYKGPSGAQLDNLVGGDKIAIFDKDHPFEGPHDEAYVGVIDRTTSTDYATVNLVTARTGGTTYVTRFSYTASPQDTTHYPDFSKGSSAGIGVVNSNDGLIYDTSPNRLPNGPGSAFYDADMGDIEQPFDDAYVEFIGLRDGMGAVPYVPKPLFDSEGVNGLAYFSQMWFKNFQPAADTPPHADVPHNYFHLIGASSYGALAGVSNSAFDWSYVFQQAIEQTSYTPAEKANYTRAVTDHELGHQFDLNFCSNLVNCNPGLPPTWGMHDYRGWWHYGGTGCPPWANPCLMEPAAGNPTDTINRFCKEDLLLGDPNAPCQSTGGTIQKVDTTVRTSTDPR
jgi:hypothetical protein